MGRLDGKVALITGGARGMGAAHVRNFVGGGARVVFGDVPAGYQVQWKPTTAFSRVFR